MGEPLVSILMPTYRRPHYLRNSLRTAVEQTYRNLEIIVRDNASGDDTPAVVASFNDPRIKFLQSQTTVPPADNSIACLEVADGKYCMMLSDDDAIALNYVEELAGALEEAEDVAIAYSGGRLIDDEGREVGGVSPAGRLCMETKDFLLAWCKGSLPINTTVSMMLRTHLLREVIPKLHSQRFPEGHNSDNALAFWMALRGKVFFSDRTVYSYRVHPGNTSHRLSNRMHLVGDRGFIEFLAEQSKADQERRLTRADWQEVRGAVRFALAWTYFSRAIESHAPNQRVTRNLVDLAVHPLGVFGVSVVVHTLLRKLYHFARSRRSA